MSTYLVAFVVGEYDFVETRSADGILVRVYTPVGKAEQGKFALEVGSVFGLQIYSVCVLNRPPTTTCVLLLQVAAKTLPFYKDYFNVPYPLPKIDLIAIADFAAGKVSSNWPVVQATTILLALPLLLTLFVFHRSHGKLGPGYIQVHMLLPCIFCDHALLTAL